MKTQINSNNKHKNTYTTINLSRKAEVFTLILDQVDFKAHKITMGEELSSLIIEISSLRFHKYMKYIAPMYRASKYRNPKLIELQKEIIKFAKSWRH
jgi:hypothetical protein